MLVTVSVVGGLFVLPSVAWAHGPAEPDNPPVPTEFLAAGAGLAAVLLVVVTVRSGSSSASRSTATERILDWPWLRPVGFVVGLVSVAVFLIGVVAGFVGSDDPTRNPLPSLISPIFWPAVPLVAAAVGNLYPAFSPWRRLAEVFGLGERERLLHEERVGYWPGTVIFVLFVWMELVYPFRADPRHLAVAVLVYTAYALVYIDTFGRDTALETGDGFGLYGMLAGGIGPFEKTGGGDLVWRGWLRGLPELAERPGLVAMAVAMVGTAAFDGVVGTAWWRDTVAAVVDPILGSALADPWRGAISGSVGLAAAVAVVWVGYIAAVAVTARAGGAAASEVASGFAHTLVPIAVAYVFAHYLVPILAGGRRLLALLSDPFARGWNLLGVAVPQITDVGSPVWAWVLQVAGIVAGLAAALTLTRRRIESDLDGSGPALGVRTAIPAFQFVLALGGLAILGLG